MIKTKKGEMTISTIVAIALAVVVLIFLIYGFSTGWGNLWDKITNIGGTSANVDSTTLACNNAATLCSYNAYHNQTRTLKISQTDKGTPGNCTYFKDHGAPGIEDYPTSC